MPSFATIGAFKRAFGARSAAAVREDGGTGSSLRLAAPTLAQIQDAIASPLPESDLDELPLKIKNGSGVRRYLLGGEAHINSARLQDFVRVHRDEAITLLAANGPDQVKALLLDRIKSKDPGLPATEHATLTDEAYRAMVTELAKRALSEAELRELLDGIQNLRQVSTIARTLEKHKVSSEFSGQIRDYFSATLRERGASVHDQMVFLRSSELFPSRQVSSGTCSSESVIFKRMTKQCQTANEATKLLEVARESGFLQDVDPKGSTNAAGDAFAIYNCIESLVSANPKESTRFILQNQLIEDTSPGDAIRASIVQAYAQDDQELQNLIIELAKRGVQAPDVMNIANSTMFIQLSMKDDNPWTAFRVVPADLDHGSALNDDDFSRNYILSQNKWAGDGRGRSLHEIIEPTIQEMFRAPICPWLQRQIDQGLANGSSLDQVKKKLHAKAIGNKEQCIYALSRHQAAFGSGNQDLIDMSEFALTILANGSTIEVSELDELIQMVPTTADLNRELAALPSPASFDSFEEYSASIKRELDQHEAPQTKARYKASGQIGSYKATGFQLKKTLIFMKNRFDREHPC